VALQEYTREMTSIKNTMQSQRALLSFLEKWGLSRMGSHRALWAVARLALVTAEKVGGMKVSSLARASVPLTPWYGWRTHPGVS
jgi:hypothetical protein